MSSPDLHDDESKSVQCVSLSHTHAHAHTSPEDSAIHAGGKNNPHNHHDSQAIYKTSLSIKEVFVSHLPPHHQRPAFHVFTIKWPRLRQWNIAQSYKKQFYFQSYITQNWNIITTIPALKKNLFNQRRSEMNRHKVTLSLTPEVNSSLIAGFDTIDSCSSSTNRLLDQKNRLDSLWLLLY